jgi:uncharacterized BrkB/YihY/UPF0761 family membrane protein
MYRQNAAPPPPDPREIARQQVKNCATMQLAIVGLAAINVAFIAMSLWFSKLPDTLRILFDVQRDAWGHTLLIVLAALLGFAAWAGVNAWGLGKRSKVARWSSIGFSVAMCTTCIATPFGAFLLFMLLKRDVKSYFD